MKIQIKKTYQLLKAVKEEGYLITEVIDLLRISRRKNIVELKEGDTINVSVNKGLTMERLMKNGNYTYVDSHIEKQQFYIIGSLFRKKKNISAKLFSFNEEDNVQVIKEKMNKDGFRPATLVELLILAYFYSNLKNENAILALGYLWKNPMSETCVAFLSFDDKRQLNACPINKWTEGDLFLGISKSTDKKVSIHEPYRYLYFYGFKLATRRVRDLFNYIFKSFSVKKA